MPKDKVKIHKEFNHSIYLKKKFFSVVLVTLPSCEKDLATLKGNVTLSHTRLSINCSDEGREYQ